MNMKFTIYSIMAMLTLSVAGIRAQEIEIPEDAPRETWQLVYDDYRSIHDSHTPEYKDLTMNVTVVLGERCLYIQGLAKSCPTSWVKVGFPNDEQLPNTLLLWSSQSVEVAGETQYLNTGSLNYQVNSGNTFSSISISCASLTPPLILKRNLESDMLEYEAAESTGFWLNKKPDEGLYFSNLTRWNDEGTIIEEIDFPEAEVYVHPRLIDKTGGTAGLNTPTGDDADAPIYTLSGIEVDRNNLTPGVYVSRGRKIVVR